MFSIYVIRSTINVDGEPIVPYNVTLYKLILQNMLFFDRNVRFYVCKTVASIYDIASEVWLSWDLSCVNIQLPLLPSIDHA